MIRTRCCERLRELQNCAWRHWRRRCETQDPKSSGMLPSGDGLSRRSQSSLEGRYASVSYASENLTCGNSRLMAIANILSCRSGDEGVGSVGIIRGGTRMYILHQQRRRLIAAALLCLICPCIVRAADDTTFTKEQIKNFLLTAKVVKSEQARQGITGTLQLTLTDGTVTHLASFQ